MGYKINQYENVQMYDFVISSRKRRMDIYYIYILEYISTSWYESGKVINRVFDRQIDSYSVLKEIYILFYWKITDERRIKTFVPKSRMSKETLCGSNQNDESTKSFRLRPIYIYIYIYISLFTNLQRLHSTLFFLSTRLFELQQHDIPRYNKYNEQRLIHDNTPQQLSYPNRYTQKMWPVEVTSHIEI